MFICEAAYELTPVFLGTMSRVSWSVWFRTSFCFLFQSVFGFREAEQQHSAAFKYRKYRKAGPGPVRRSGTSLFSLIPVIQQQTQMALELFISVP